MVANASGEKSSLRSVACYVSNSTATNPATLNFLWTVLPNSKIRNLFPLPIGWQHPSLHCSVRKLARQNSSAFSINARGSQQTMPNLSLKLCFYWKRLVFETTLNAEKSALKHCTKATRFRAVLERQNIPRIFQGRLTLTSRTSSKVLCGSLKKYSSRLIFI